MTTPHITYDATFEVLPDGDIVRQVPGTLLPGTILTLHFPNGTVTMLHHGTHLELRRAWDRHNTYLAAIPTSSGELAVALMPFPPDQA